MAAVDLAAELAALHGGAEEWEPQALLGEFRRSIVLVPLDEGSLMSAEQAGVRWIYAFTSEETLADFASQRGVTADVPYAKVRGARLLDVVVPGVEGPTGVAIDVGGAGFLLPPSVEAVTSGLDAEPVAQGTTEGESGGR